MRYLRDGSCQLEVMVGYRWETVAEGSGRLGFTGELQRESCWGAGDYGVGVKE